MKNLQYILFITIVFLSEQIHSQENIKSTFTNYSEIQGRVNTIVIDPANQDKWIGTDNGLVKLSDTSFTFYNSANSGLPDSTINAIAIDANGDKWIGTNKGLVKLNDTSFTIFNITNSKLPNNVINDIAIEAKGYIWIGTNGGIARHSDSIIIVYNTENSELPNNKVNAITIDARGDKWIGTFGGFMQVSGNSFSVYYKKEEKLPINNINVVTIDGDTLWIGTEGGFGILSGLNFEVFEVRKNQGLPGNKIGDIAKELTGGKWIGTNNGLAFFNNGIFTTLNTANSSIPHNSINTIAVDVNGDKWIGTDEGIAKLQTCFIPVKPSILFGDTIVCAGTENVLYSIAEIKNAISFIWDLPTEAIGESDSSAISIDFSLEAISGILSVKGENKCGIGNPQSIDITVKAVKIPQIETKWDEDILICPNTENTFTSYQWSINGDTIPGATEQYFQTYKELGNYTVIAVNTNGCISESEPQSIAKIKSAIFFNPATETVNYTITNEKKGEVQMNIYSMQGIKIKSTASTKRNIEFFKSVPVSEFEQGIYCAELILQNTRFAETIVITK